jgi:GDPmannose 4,6-dehydratase
MEKIGLILGITGQDGSYLSELLLEKKYIVYGIIRRSSSINTNRIEHILSKLNLRYGDITDYVSISNVVNEIKNKYPDLERLEIYNLAAQSHVQVSFSLPIYTAQVDAIGTLNILEVIKESNIANKIRFYQASTSELYGKIQEPIQNETTPFYPRSPYGCAKIFSYWIVKNYRESYNMFLCNGILFNHESPRRTHNFVTRKITIGLGKILRGEESKLVLGQLSSLRDWGHAKDYVYGMWLILQKNIPDDYVLATGKNYSIREFVEKSFSLRGFDIKWKGDGINEIGYDANTKRELIFVDSKYFRPAEVIELLGDNTKAKKELGWETKISFDELIKEMVDQDCPKNLTE